MNLFIHIKKIMNMISYFHHDLHCFLWFLFLFLKLFIILSGLYFCQLFNSLKWLIQTQTHRFFLSFCLSTLTLVVHMFVFFSSNNNRKIFVQIYCQLIRTMYNVISSNFMTFVLTHTKKKKLYVVAPSNASCSILLHNNRKQTHLLKRVFVVRF